MAPAHMGAMITSSCTRSTPKSLPALTGAPEPVAQRLTELEAFCQVLHCDGVHEYGGIVHEQPGALGVQALENDAGRCQRGGGAGSGLSAVRGGFQALHVCGRLIYGPGAGNARGGSCGHIPSSTTRASLSDGHRVVSSKHSGSSTTPYLGNVQGSCGRTVLRPHCHGISALVRSAP